MMQVMAIVAILGVCIVAYGIAEWWFGDE